MPTNRGGGRFFNIRARAVLRRWLVIHCRPMKTVQLLISDLFLPHEYAADVCAGLQLPALERLLARAVAAPSGGTQASGHALEQTLCALFGMPGAPLASVSAAFDGLEPGCWLRADPVHLRLQREQVVLLPNVALAADEAGALCASLNAHFSGQGVEFCAPHPQRWYLRVPLSPDIRSVPLSRAAGRNIHGLLPTGADERRWRQLFNEVQMLLFAHPLNEEREARGELPVNSVWLWGEGAQQPGGTCRLDAASSDDLLAEMLAKAAGLPFSAWAERWKPEGQPEAGGGEGAQLLVWTGLSRALQRGDLAGWRQALQDFETGYAQPLWQALKSGGIARLELDVLGGERLRRCALARRDAWSVWRRPIPLADYSVASARQK